MFLKSNPSEPARDTKITLILDPSLLSSAPAAFTIAALFVDNVLSPVISAYFNAVSFVLLTDGDFNIGSPEKFINPLSSNASATGKSPPSKYCEYTKTIPSEFSTLSTICAIFALYCPIKSFVKIFPNFFRNPGLYL